MITPTVKETSICIINCPDISTFININGMSLIQSFSEILHRKIYVGNVFSLHAKIKARMEYPTENGKNSLRLIETTPGRVKLSEILPLNVAVNFDVLNQLMTKKQVTNVIDYISSHLQ